MHVCQVHVHVVRKLKRCSERMVNNHDHSGGLLPSVRHIAKQPLSQSQSVPGRQGQNKDKVDEPAHQADVDESLVDADAKRMFPNAMRIPGVLHIADNCLGNILQSTCSWQPLLKSLRLVETLLAKPLYRERFLHFNVDDRTSREKLKSWSLNLRGLRWQAVMEFTLALKDVEHILR